MNKGNGKHPQGVRWLVRTNSFAGRIWATHNFYTRAELLNWWFARPLQPLFPLDITL